MEKCNLCPRNCNVDRKNKTGFCGVKNLKIQKVMVHFWEEPYISGTNGSGAIFFSGCNLKCLYCQNYVISSLNKGKEITVQNLVDIFKYLERLNVHNINLVTPTHFTDEILMALKMYKPKIPIVWNTSGYEKVETLKKLTNFVDIFLFDFKYCSSTLSEEYSKAKDYFNKASESLEFLHSTLGENKFENGLLTHGLVIRHLVLPKTTLDSIDILNYINKSVGNKVLLSILNQYTPYHKALNHEVLKNKVSKLEYKRVVKHAINLNFENALVQEESSSNECFIPNFNEELNLENLINSH